MKAVLFIFLLCSFYLNSQSYQSYFTGNTTDVQTNSLGGVCLMGGASENDNAMKWFLQQANGGDILVLRASGSDGYNNYMYSQLGVSVNSVETIVFNNATAANESYIHQKIKQAEAIWFAGGNQWKYISYWRNTPIANLINEAIKDRNITIGGTSAGMAIQGEFYYSAKNGTVTSSEALQNPFHNNLTVENAPFIENYYLKNVITDTHYDNPDRKGRHVSFLARIVNDFNTNAKGIACDEYTAVCIDTDGIAKVFGEFPNENDTAYFIQTNCAISNAGPETLLQNTPLDWNLDGKALQVYAVKGTSDGTNTFNLNDWKTGNGGNWQNWYVTNGIFKESNGNAPNCSSLSTGIFIKNKRLKIYPNPGKNNVVISLQDKNKKLNNVRIFDAKGRLVKEIKDYNSQKIEVNTVNFSSGVYIIEITTNNNKLVSSKFILK